MKKRYEKPVAFTVKMKPASLICASVEFGDGETSSMHAKDDTGIDDAEIVEEK